MYMNKYSSRSLVTDAQRKHNPTDAHKNAITVIQLSLKFFTFEQKRKEMKKTKHFTIDSIEYLQQHMHTRVHTAQYTRQLCTHTSKHFIAYRIYKRTVRIIYYVYYKFITKRPIAVQKAQRTLLSLLYVNRLMKVAYVVVSNYN